MKKYTYVKIKVHEGSSHICAINELQYFLSTDLQDLSEGDKLTITFEPVLLTDSGVQETYRVLFKGTVVYAIWSFPLQIVKTVLRD